MKVEPTPDKVGVRPKLDKAGEAVKRAEAVNYTTTTSGWDLIQKEIDKEINWAFEKSISPDFCDKVKEKPETYFEHYGYVNGLKQIDRIIKKIIMTGEVASKDIEKWQSKTNPVL